MTFENRIARIEAKRAGDAGDRPEHDLSKSESGTTNLVLWALFLGLAWAALAFPFGAALAMLILGPIGALFVLPYLWFRRNRRASPERQAILDLLNQLNPFS